MDTIRILRIYEFVGPRDLVEEQVRRSIAGERAIEIRQPDGKILKGTIRAATIGTFPEILARKPT